MLIPVRCRLSSLAISASFCCVMRLSGVLAIIDPTGGQSRRETVVSHAAHRLPVRLPGFDGGSVRRRDKGFRGFTGAAEQHASGDERRACQRHFAG